MLWSYYRWCEKSNETVQVIFQIINNELPRCKHRGINYGNPPMNDSNRCKHRGNFLNIFFVVPTVLLFIFAGKLENNFFRTVVVASGVLWFLMSSTSKVYFNCKMKRLSDHDWKWRRQRGTEDFLVRWLFTLGLAVIAGIPFWLYLLAKLAFGPSNFMENAILLGIFMCVGGIAQLVFIIIWICLLFGFWSD